MMNSLPLQTRQTLKALGFSDMECKILMPLFAHRRLTTKQISQQSALSFENVHYALHALEKKKLVRRTSRRGEDTVEMCSNEEFLRWIEEQKKSNADIYDDAKSVVNTFLTTFMESAWKPDVMYFEGKQGVIDIYKDILQEGKDVYGWTDIRKINDTIGDYMEEFIRERIKRKITTHVIMPAEVKSSPIVMRHQKLNIRRFSKHLQIDGEIRMYGNKVAVITFHRKKPVGFVFSGPVISAIFRGIFEHAWKGCVAEKLS